MRLRNSVLMVVAVLLMSACVGVQDAEGWRSNQKSEFLDILENDTYASICTEQKLYNDVKSSHNSKLMTKLLVAYTENLANGCIDLKTFNAAQKKRNSIYFSSKYTTYAQKVDAKKIKMQLKAGKSIEQILQPYVPEYYQFRALITSYQNLSQKSDTSKALLHKIRLNIERVKLMRPGLGKTYALVNIPEFEVRVIENDKTSIAMRVITGKKSKQTPIFSADLKYIVLNPTWNVPDSIARHEVIPKALKDPGYLAKHRLVVRRDYNIDSPALSFNAEKAKAYVGGKGDVPFKFIEVSSRHNALGRVKFIFPNQNSVYMHDTPSKYLFKRKVRAYSHGCVRLGEPMKMLDFIAANYTKATPKEVNTQYKSLKTHYMTITKSLPVHTAYLTTYVDEKGLLHSFADIYGYDTLQKLKF